MWPWELGTSLEEIKGSLPDGNEDHRLFKGILHTKVWYTEHSSYYPVNKDIYV